MTRSAVVLGGSVAGTATALQLARAGWPVTVLDPELEAMRRPGDRPSSRPGAPHTVQAHTLGTRVHAELATRLPDVAEALLAAGTNTMEIGDGLVVLQCRRHTFDRVLAEALHDADVIRVPVRATGLLLERGCPPRAVGLVLEDGREVRADVVVDAGGRRSPVTRWLHEAGVEQPEQRDASVARYYTRHMRVTGERPPLNMGFADVQPFTCHVQLLFLGDDDTAMLAMAAHDRDPVLKALRHPEAFDAVVAANPGFADWAAVLEPDSEVFCLGAFDDRARSLVADGRPVVLGLHQVGDALTTTNPTRGRGVAMALMGVGALVDALTEHRDPAGAALAFEDWRRRALLPAYLECAHSDAIASRQREAGLAGQALPLQAPQVLLPDGHPISPADLEHAASYDPALLRVLRRAVMLLDDERHVASDEVAARVREVLAEHPREDAAGSPLPSGGLHERAEVERLLAAYA